jgi:hypothetical protein
MLNTVSCPPCLACSTRSLPLCFSCRTTQHVVPYMVCADQFVTHSRCYAFTVARARGAYYTSVPVVYTIKKHASLLSQVHTLPRFACCERGGAAGAVAVSPPIATGNMHQHRCTGTHIDTNVIAHIHTHTHTHARARVREQVHDKIMAGASASPVKKLLFTQGLAAKRARMRKTGDLHHPFWDKLVFRKVSDSSYTPMCSVTVRSCVCYPDPILSPHE